MNKFCSILVLSTSSSYLNSSFLSQLMLTEYIMVHGYILPRAYIMLSAWRLCQLQKSLFNNNIQNSTDDDTIQTGLHKFKSLVKLHFVLPSELLGIPYYSLNSSSSYPFGALPIWDNQDIFPKRSNKHGFLVCL